MYQINTTNYTWIVLSVDLHDFLLIVETKTNIQLISQDHYYCVSDRIVNVFCDSFCCIGMEVNPEGCSFT